MRIKNCSEKKKKHMICLMLLSRQRKYNQIQEKVNFFIINPPIVLCTAPIGQWDSFYFWYSNNQSKPLRVIPTLNSCSMLIIRFLFLFNIVFLTRRKECYWTLKISRINGFLFPIQKNKVNEISKYKFFFLQKYFICVSHWVAQIGRL